MSLRALAFGPLPKSQVQASQRLSLPASSGSSMSGGSGGEFDAPMTGGGPLLRQPEAFNPVFPDLFGQPEAGAEAPAPDFNSETAQTLANPPQGTGVAPPASNLPEAWRTDLDAAFKSLKALQGGVKAIEGPQQQPVPSQQGGPDLDALARTAGGDTFSAGQPGSQVSGGEIGDLGQLDAGIFEPELGGGGGPAVSPGLGSLTSLYGLGTAAASGNPIGIAQGAINSYNALTGLVGQISSSSVTPISSAIVSAAPEIASAIAESAGIATAGMTTAELTGALSGALAAWGGAAAPIIQGIVEYINNAEQMRMRDSGWRNNPIAGALYSNSTAGVGQANKLFDSLGSDLTGANTQDLLGALIGGTNSLLPYYSTAQGGRGPIRASDTVTGRKQGPTSSGTPYTGDGASPEQYTGNFTSAQDKLVAAVNELMRRGATYEELGQLPVSGNWALESLDAGGRPEDFLAKSPRAAEFATEGSGLFGQSGLSALAGSAPAPGEGGGWSMDATKTQPEQIQELLRQALGASGKAPDSVTHASTQTTDMYGGPLWTALGRMGAGGPSLQDLIAQKFDPWVNARKAAPGSWKAPASTVDPAAYQAFTSGGS